MAYYLRVPPPITWLVISTTLCVPCLAVSAVRLIRLTRESQLTVITRIWTSCSTDSHDCPSQWPALNRNQGTILSATVLPSTQEFLHHEDSGDRNRYDVGRTSVVLSAQFRESPDACHDGDSWRKNTRTTTLHLLLTHQHNIILTMTLADIYKRWVKQLSFSGRVDMSESASRILRCGFQDLWTKVRHVGTEINSVVT